MTNNNGDTLDTDDYIVALISEYTKNHVRDIERFIGALKACGYSVVKDIKPTGDRVAALDSEVMKAIDWVKHMWPLVANRAPQDDAAIETLINAAQDVQGRE